jgi:hypothetical protein
MRNILLLSVAALALAAGSANAQTRQTPAPEYSGGAGSPSSNAASNTSAANARPGSAPRLPDPGAANDSPAALLTAARTALDHGRTGAAQEALERAETRILSRTTDPSRASEPAQSAMSRHIAEARRALGNKDSAAAKAAIDLALASPVPPTGPAVTVTIPGAPRSGY